ncbi:hypothetical protein DL96DRAFT_1719428 [Flagelloscypha sp. PMI_526]|nr:hypothetical protein DL96DRAFT_1719428 [Flagelloscypha sp. PMI_526]
MSPTLAPELWTQILAFLPYSSLDQVKCVDRAFYQICRGRTFEVLDVIPIFTGGNPDEHLGVLKKRLTLARTHSHLIKKLRFMPVIRLPLYYTEKQLQPKPIPFLRRIFGKEENVAPIIIKRSTSQDMLSKATEI